MSTAAHIEMLDLQGHEVEEAMEGTEKKQIPLGSIRHWRADSRAYRLVPC